MCTETLEEMYTVNKLKLKSVLCFCDLISTSGLHFWWRIIHVQLKAAWSLQWLWAESLKWWTCLPMKTYISKHVKWHRLKFVPHNCEFLVLLVIINPYSNILEQWESFAWLTCEISPSGLWEITIEILKRCLFMCANRGLRQPTQVQIPHDKQLWQRMRRHDIIGNSNTSKHNNK